MFLRALKLSPLHHLVIYYFHGFSVLQIKNQVKHNVNISIYSIETDPCAYIERRSCSIFRNNDQNKPSPNKEEIPGYAEDSVVLDSPTKTSSEFYQDLPLLGSERSTLTDDSSLKINEEDKIKERETCENDSSFYTALLNQKQTTNTTANNTSNNDEEKMGKQGSLFSSSRPSFAKSKSYSNGASSMFRNWIKCGAVETKDSVLVSVNRADKACSTKSTNATHPDKMAAVICQGDKYGGSARIFGTPWNNQQYSHRYIELNRITFNICFMYVCMYSNNFCTGGALKG